MYTKCNIRGVGYLEISKYDIKVSIQQTGGNEPICEETVTLLTHEMSNSLTVELFCSTLKHENLYNKCFFREEARKFWDVSLQKTVETILDT